MCVKYSPYVFCSTPIAKKMSHNFCSSVCANLRLNFWSRQMLFCDKDKLLALRFQRMSWFAYDSWLIVLSKLGKNFGNRCHAVWKMGSWKEAQRMKSFLIGQEWLVHVAFKSFKMQHNLGIIHPTREYPIMLLTCLWFQFIFFLIFHYILAI